MRACCWLSWVWLLRLCSACSTRGLPSRWAARVPRAAASLAELRLRTRRPGSRGSRLRTRRPRSRGSPALDTQARQSWHKGLIAPEYVQSSQVRDQTRIPYTGRRILYYRATREAQWIHLYEVFVHMLNYFLRINTFGWKYWVESLNILKVSDAHCQIFYQKYYIILLSMVSIFLYPIGLNIMLSNLWVW